MLRLFEGWGMTRDLRIGPRIKRDDRLWNSRFGARVTLSAHNLPGLLACVKAQGCLTFRFTFAGNSLTLERIPLDRYSAFLELLSTNRSGTPGTVSGLLEITSQGGYSVEVKKCGPAAQTAVRDYLATLSPLRKITGTGSAA